MIVSLFAAAVLAQSSPPGFTVQNSRVHAPIGMASSFWAGYARSGSGDWVVEIYARQFQGRGEYVLRRSLNIPEGREQETWTTSTNCPVVLNIVKSMERLSLGGLDAAPPLEAPPRPWFVFPETIPVQPESSGYVIWGQGRQPDGAAATYQVWAGNGLIAGFIEHADEALHSCWRESLEAGSNRGVEPAGQGSSASGPR